MYAFVKGHVYKKTNIYTHKQSKPHTKEDQYIYKFTTHI